MRRLLAIFGGLTGILILPLGLVAPTAWLLVPAHAAFTALCILGALLSAARGAADAARRWGAWHIVATIGAMTGFELGRRAQEGAWWMAPWLLILLWAWIPMVVAGLAGAVGERLGRAWDQRVVARRRVALAAAVPPPR